MYQTAQQKGMDEQTHIMEWRMEPLGLQCNTESILETCFVD